MLLAATENLIQMQFLTGKKKKNPTNKKPKPKTNSGLYLTSKISTTPGTLPHHLSYETANLKQSGHLSSQRSSLPLILEQIQWN